MADDDALRVRRELRRRQARRHRGHGVAIGLVLALLVIAGGGAATALVIVARSPDALVGCHLASAHAHVVGRDSFLFATDGSRLGAVPTSRNREPVALDQTSHWIPAATVSIEDRRFWSHGALDYAGIGRAALADLKAGQVVQGGSSITQQLVRDRYLDRQTTTLSRKLTEACLAVELARVWPKRRILEAYLNTVFYGHHAFGVEAAARTYFSRSSAHLSLVQAALLAGLPQAPSEDDPFRHPAAAIARRNEVLAALRRDGEISGARHRIAAASPLRLQPNRRYSQVRFPTFFDAARRELDRRYGSARVRHGGLHVQTTLDARVQRLAGRAIAGWIHGPSDPAAVLVAIDPRNGAIRALATTTPGHPPGRRFNLATQSHRQAGSAFKVFTLTTALQQGIPLSSVWHGPASLTVADRRCMNADGPWVVHNFADEATGTMDLVQAIAHSVNTIFAQVAVRVGPQSIVRTAHRMGIRSPLKAVCSITLGPEGVSPLDMTDAFATLASGGVHHNAEALGRITTARRAVLTPHPTGRRVLTARVAGAVTSALTGVIRGGTGTAADPGRPAAGKTGTAENYKDAWFCGFVPQLAACVWIGYPQAERPMANLDGFAQVVGGSVPARIWHDFMVPAMAGRRVVPLPGVGAAQVALPSPTMTGGATPAPPASAGPPPVANARGPGPPSVGGPSTAAPPPAGR